MFVEGIGWIRSTNFDYEHFFDIDYMTFFVLDLREKPAQIKSYMLDDSFNKNKSLFSTRIFDLW